MDPSQFETATIGGGCFWCLEAVFQELDGVASVQSGYSGGARENPTYEQVCSGATGHAEVAQIRFDPSVTSFREILQVFFATHDPTTLNRQGADVGSQYRSAIFYHSDDQKCIAEETIREIDAAGVLNNPVVTEVSPLDRFLTRRGLPQQLLPVELVPTLLPVHDRTQAREISNAVLRQDTEIGSSAGLVPFR